MRYRRSPFIIAFGEGFLYPLIEIVTSLIISIHLPIQKTTYLNFNMTLFLLLFLFLTIIESFYIGFKDWNYGLGYLTGAGFGLILFYGYISETYPGTLQGMAFVLIIIILGIILKIVKSTVFSD